MSVAIRSVDGLVIGAALRKRVLTWRWLAIAQIAGGIVATLGIPGVLAWLMSE